jgi:hypothetical protein
MDVQSTVQENPSALKIERPALQKMTYIIFFLFLWVIFAGSRDPIKSGSGPTSLVQRRPILYPLKFSLNLSRVPIKRVGSEQIQLAAYMFVK